MNNNEINSPISLNYLNQKIIDLEGQTQQLKNQMKEALKRMETTSDKFKSLNDFKKEFKAFFSRNGYSVLLETSSIFKKVFWLSCMIVLFVTGMNLVVSNVKEYEAHDVVTHIKDIYVETLTFPAITFCLAEYSPENPTLIKSRDLRSVFSYYYFEFENFLNLNLFEFISIDTYSIDDQSLDCYVFKGEQNQKVGRGTGLFLTLNMSKNDVLYYHIGYDNIRPLFSELESLTYTERNFVYIGLKKTVDLMLPKPYSNCKENINSKTSYFVDQIAEQNITYRQKYCYELCFNSFLNKFAISLNISKYQAKTLFTFDYKGNCSQLCPLECKSTSFEILKSEITTSYEGFTTNFYFIDRKYTEISQTVKTTGADLISNTGGVLGLFLELSFFSASRFIIYFYDFIFV